jgi:hypothetical protein
MADYAIRVVNEQNTTSPVVITNNEITGARIGIFAMNSPGINIGADGSSLLPPTPLPWRLMTD